MCVQDIFISLSLIPKHSSLGCVLWGGAGAAVFLRPKLNIVTFLDFLDLFFHAESRLVREAGSQKHCRSIMEDLWTRWAMVLKGDPAAQVREGWSAHVRMSCNLQK